MAKEARTQVGRASLPARVPDGISIPNVSRATFDGYRRRLPHWRLPGASYFVTWRLFPGQIDLMPEERSLVVNALKHFDSSRYLLLAYVVMNDHVHVLVQPMGNYLLEEITHSWKSFTANRAQRVHNRTGRLWMDESFDRIVRHEEEFFEKFYYVLNNPFKRWPELKAYEWMGVHEELSDVFSQS